MKTDVIEISSKGSGMEAALQQAEKVAAYKGLTGKNAIHLRLLTEEMMGMMRGITGETKGEFWIEDKDDTYQLHLRVLTRMNFDKRDQLLAASTSGKNEAAKGLMGRLRAFFDQGSDTTATTPLYLPTLEMMATTATLDWEWSMTAYERALEQAAPKDAKAKEIWDELEKSVVTHVADEIKVSIRGDHAEMIILKKIAS